MEDNNYECLFNVNDFDCKKKLPSDDKTSETKKLTTNTKNGNVTPQGYNPMDYFKPTNTQPKIILKSNPTQTTTGTQPIQSPMGTTQKQASNSLQLKGGSNDGILTQEQIDQVEKILPNGQRTSLYMYYYNYYSKVRPGRNQEYYDNLITQYMKICKERLSRINEERQSAEHSRRLLMATTDVVVGPKISKREELTGNLFYWFGINKIDRVLKWHDTVADKDQNDFDQVDFICYRRNAFLRKNWCYVSKDGFKYIPTSFEAHSVIMASTNQNSFSQFAYNCGYKAAPKRIFLEYVTSS
uniref:C-type lectin domain-containing protein n=1 Tax=Strongyloides papillosus TaxID=174720 RepID=A0A0N5CI57_STREA